MKTTTTSKVTLFILVLLMSIGTAFSQNAVGMRIDVQGSRYSDQMWVFSDPITTRGYDNGYDGFKMFGTSTLIPQLFAIEEAGNFQIDAVPDLNNTFIGFKAGEDSLYTLTFTSGNLNRYYTALYLQDLVTDKIVDIYQSGSMYTFSVTPLTDVVKRFVILTSLPVVAVDTVVVEIPKDTVVKTLPVVLPTIPNAPAGPDEDVASDTTTVNDQPQVVENDDIAVVVADEDVDNSKSIKNNKDNKDKIKINIRKNIVEISNDSQSKGQLKVINASNGNCVMESQFAPNSTTSFELNFRKGVYVVVAITSNQMISKRTKVD